MEQKLPQRKRIRLKDYDYSTAGFYFITICTYERKQTLCKIKKDLGGGLYPSFSVQMTRVGKIVEEFINDIPKIYNNIIIDEYKILPNHLHMIIVLEIDNKYTISRIIGQFKKCVSKELRQIVWQKSYYEHIIRNKKEYIEIKSYIVNNLIKWEKDRYYN
jgi:REP element-mobilizing transposase RayT